MIQLFLQQLEIKFIYHTVHPFKVYSLVGFVYSQGCANVTTIQFQNILVLKKTKNPRPIISDSPTLSPAPGNP